MLTIPPPPSPSAAWKRAKAADDKRIQAIEEMRAKRAGARLSAPCGRIMGLPCNCGGKDRQKPWHG